MATTSPLIPQRVIAITGGIGSGKTTVAQFFERLGAVVVRADELARVATAKGSDGLRAIEKSFGNEFLTEDGELNRKKLGGVVFNDPQKRKTLEGILHPIIRQLWLERLALLRNTSTAPIIIYDVPLIFESGQKYPEIEEIILVTAPEESRIQRVLTRDASSREQILDRMRSQLSDTEKATRSSYIISNDGSLDHLETQCRELFERLKP